MRDHQPPARPHGEVERSRVLNAVPSWRSDLGRAARYALGISVGATVLLFVAARWGLYSTKTFEWIEGDATFAGLLASAGTLMWAFMMFVERPDLHYLDGGPPALITLTVPVASLVTLAPMAVWPLIVDNTAPDVVAATMVSDPRSLLLVACLVCASHAWFTAVVVGLTGGSWQSRLAWGLALVPLVFAVLFGAVHVFSNPPGAVSFVVWWALAVLGLLAVAALVVIRARQEGPAR